MSKKILLLGSYGQTNLGDDLLMWNYLNLLKQRGFTDIWVNVSTTELIPRAVREAFPNLHMVELYKTSTLQWIRILRQVDYVAYGGGTIYKEMYGSTGRFKHGVTMRMAGFNTLARLCGAKIYNLNIGTGSVKTRLGRVFARLGLRPATYTIFRDQQSYDFVVGALKLPAKRFCASTDGLFLNRVWQKPWHTLPLDIDRKQYKAVVGVNMLSDIPDWVDRKQYLATMRKLLRQLLESGYFVLLIPFQHAFNPRDDHTFTEKEITPYIQGHAKQWKLLPKVELDEVVSVLQACDVLVGMRFHSLLLATAAQTPFVAITYDTKCARFTEEAQYPYTIPLETVTPDAALGMVQDVLKNKKNVKKQLHAIADGQYNEAEDCLRKLPW